MHKPIIGGSAGVQRWRRQCSSGNDTGVQFKTPTLFNFTDATVHFKATYSAETPQYKINAFTHPSCHVVTEKESIESAKWGLIPYWTKTAAEAGKIRKICLNARTETVFDLPSFRNPVLAKRCLIPATGYFEFHHQGKSAIPYYIFLKDEEIFSFGGLYETWRNPELGGITQTFTILTVPANKLCAEIHNGGKNPFRMPLIISRKNEDEWLDHKLRKSDIKQFFQPFDTDMMDAWPVSNDFLKKSPDDASIVELETRFHP